MKLHFKPVFYLLGRPARAAGGLRTVSAIPQRHRLAETRSRQRGTTLEAGEWKAAENVFLSVQHAVSGFAGTR